MTEPESRTGWLGTLSGGLLATGLVVGLAGIAAWQFDLLPALSPSMVKLVLAKVLMGGALGLLGVGALVRRASRPSVRASEALAGELNGPEPSSVIQNESAGRRAVDKPGER